MKNFLWSEFPPLEWAIAYGSNVFPQKNYTHEEKINSKYDEKKQESKCVIDRSCEKRENNWNIKCMTTDERIIDYIFLVKKKNLINWHAQLQKNSSHHYSFLFSLLGPLYTSHFQFRMEPPIFYNTLVYLRRSDIWCKYGVMTIEDFQDDLRNWNSFYVSSRLQKPVLFRSPQNLDLREATFFEDFMENRRNALRLAILLLPSQFSLRRLLFTICGLSYCGDIRMLFAENPQKVNNILNGQANELLSIYFPLLKELGFLEMNTADCSKIATEENSTDLLDYILDNTYISLCQEREIHCRTDVLATLPEAFRDSVYKLLKFKVFVSNASDFILRVNKQGRSTAKEMTCLNGVETKKYESKARHNLEFFSPEENKKNEELLHCNATCIYQVLFFKNVCLSTRAAFKNALSAGFKKTIKYGLRKISKRFPKLF